MKNHWRIVWIVVCLFLGIAGCSDNGEAKRADAGTSGGTGDTMTTGSRGTDTGSGSFEDTGEGTTGSTDTLSGETTGGDTVGTEGMDSDTETPGVGPSGTESDSDTSGEDTDTGSGAPCVPDCNGAICGDDGCGGSCGGCPAGTSCLQGVCQASSCEVGCTAGCVQGCFDLGACTGDDLSLYPNIHTVGVVVDDGGTDDGGDLYYRAAGSATWWKGPEMTRIPDGRLAGSIFYLAPETDMEVMVVTPDATACGRTRTLPETPIHTAEETVYVDASASPGGNGSATAPFDTIQGAVNHAGAGTDIVVRPGVYAEEVRVEGGGDEDRYLRLLGEAGSVMEGADEAILAEGLPWTEADTHIYSAPHRGDPTYLSRDGDRFYHYTSLSGLQAGSGDDDVPMAEGWYVEGGDLYVRCLDHPDNHQWQVPSLTTAIGLDGAAWVWIEGLEIRNYGEGGYPKGIDVRDSRNIVIRSNHVHATPSPIWVRNGSMLVRIEGNRVHQSGMAGWPWDAVKGTDHEDSGIQISGGGRTIVRGNRIGHIFNGIYTGSFDEDQNAALAFDVDVYDNQLGSIGDDGMEPEGACINNRFWNNTVDTLHNGVSLAPITYGPVWVLRNRFSDYGAGGIKVSNDSSGRVWIYHNTCYTDREDQNGMGVSGPFENMVFRNNIIRGTRYAFEMSQPALPNDLDYDNFYTTRGAPVMKWDDVRYDSLAEMCEATGLECHGQPLAPQLIDPADGRFGLQETSPNIDRGVRIYGINDGFSGAAPDIGYREVGAGEPPLFE